MTTRKEKKKVESSWMDTYGDMVTLLLCFFVILFSMSTIDAAKWEMLVKSINPASEKVSQIVDEPRDDEGENPINSSAQGLMTDVKTFDDIYWNLKNYVEENNLTQDIEVLKGDDFTFLIFRNNIFFDGDSYILKQDGVKILNYLAGAVNIVSQEVGEIRIMGHTNQANPNTPNDIATDHFLASNRATQVLVHLERQNAIDPAKLSSVGYGQHHPVAGYVNAEDRSKNRRVEVLLLRAGAKEVSLDEIYNSAKPE